MKKWHFWLGVLISAVFLTLALRGLQIDEFWVTLQDAVYWWLLPGLVVYFLAVWVRAWRWHYMILPIKNVSTKKMFPITCIGYMGNNIYPARAGEFLRAILLKRKEGVPISTSFATIIVERVFDGVVMLGFVFLNLPMLATLTMDSGFSGSIQTLALWGAGIFLAALIFFLLAAMLPKQAEKLTRWGIKTFVPKKFRDALLSFALKFLTGLAALRSPKEALMIFFTTVIIWLLETLKYWFVMHAFDFTVSFFALMLMNGIVNLATTIPSAPGYIGTFDAPGIAVLKAFGVNPSMAAGYTLVLHAALWLPITLLGGFYMWREGIRWNDALKEEITYEKGKNDE